MSQDNATTDQGNAAPSSASAQQPPAAAQIPAGWVEKARLDGALQKIEQLTLEKNALTQQLTEKMNLLTQIQGQLTEKETNWTAQAGEFATKLQTADATKTTLEQENAALKAMALKMKVIKDLKQPALLNILDVIPDSLDEAIVRRSAETLAGFAQSMVMHREQELVAGIVPVINNPSQTQMPTNEKEWTQYVNSFGLGTPERAKAMDAWHQSVFNKG